MDILILVLFILVPVSAVMLYVKRKKLPTSSKSPISGTGGGFIPEGKGEGTGDGSITPPNSGPAAE